MMHTKKLLFSVPTLFAAGLIASTSYAATYTATWDGEANDNNIFTEKNWNIKGVGNPPANSINPGGKPEVAVTNTNLIISNANGLVGKGHFNIANTSSVTLNNSDLTLNNSGFGK